MFKRYLVVIFLVSGLLSGCASNGMRTEIVNHLSKELFQDIEDECVATNFNEKDILVVNRSQYQIYDTSNNQLSKLGELPLDKHFSGKLIPTENYVFHWTTPDIIDNEKCSVGECGYYVGQVISKKNKEIKLFKYKNPFIYAPVAGSGDTLYAIEHNKILRIDLDFSKKNQAKEIGSLPFVPKKGVLHYHNNNLYLFSRWNYTLDSFKLDENGHKFAKLLETDGSVFEFDLSTFKFSTVGYLKRGRDFPYIESVSDESLLVLGGYSSTLGHFITSNDVPSIELLDLETGQSKKIIEWPRKVEAFSIKSKKIAPNLVLVAFPKSIKLLDIEKQKFVKSVSRKTPFNEDYYLLQGRGPRYFSLCGSFATRAIEQLTVRNE